MKVILQRSIASSVKVNGQVIGAIDRGIVILVGFTEGDNSDKIDYMVKKIVNLRIFDDDYGVMNKSILDVGAAFYQFHNSLYMQILLKEIVRVI